VLINHLKSTLIPYPLYPTPYIYSLRTFVYIYQIYIYIPSGINCVFQEISLEHEDESDFIHTPLGSANITHRSISHNHMTLFWMDTYAKPTEIVLRELESGEGLWYESTTKENMILLDKAKQS
jgi:hypothetical protein